MGEDVTREDIIAPFRRTGQMQGRCSCGDVVIDVDGDYIAAVGACHCLMCQRWNGMVFGSFVAARDAVQVRGPVSVHASSSFSDRAFCTTCGSHIWLRGTDEAETEIELFPGLFPDAGSFVLLSEIYTDRAPNYAPLAGNHRRKTRAEYEAKNNFVEGDAR